MNISLAQLTKDQTNIIKGFAIILIVFHNYLHLTNSIGENEFNFDPERVYSVSHAIEKSPFIIFNVILTYFGHYGVELFVFISGYGLAKQYSKNPSIKYKKYIIPRMIKIYSLILFGLIFYVAIYNKNINFNDFILWAALKFVTVTNLFYDTIFVHVGPWWYFGLAIQLYLIFPFIYRLIFKYDEKFFFIALVICYLLIYILFPIAEKFRVPLFGNFIGHLPEFILGIGFVRFTSWKLNLKTVIPVFLLFILSNFSEHFFPFSFLTVTVILLVICYYLFQLPEFLKKSLIYVGYISMFIFLINGPLRKFTMPYLVIEGAPLLTFGGSIIHFLIVFVLAILSSYIFKATLDPLSSFLIKETQR